MAATLAACRQSTLGSAQLSLQGVIGNSAIETCAVTNYIISFLGGRNAEELQPLVRHLVKHISEPRYTKQLTGIAHRLLDLYGTAVRSGLRVQHAGLRNSIVFVYIFTIFLLSDSRIVSLDADGEVFCGSGEAADLADR